MRILVTNDDGIHAPGIALLERIARTLTDDVWVLAPEEDQSGLAHSLSLNNPLRLRTIDERHYALRGTPTDCVIMAVRRLMAEVGPPDLILAGVNAGMNVADDISYSGTVAAAIEGTLIGIPSIALSQALDWEDGHRKVPWQTAEKFAPELIEQLIEFGFPGDILYNVNFPNCAPEAVRGRKVTQQGRLMHSLYIDERFDGRHNPYYWLAFNRPEHNLVEGTDMHAVRDGYISLTPLRLDLTDYDVVQQLRARLG